MKHIVKTHGHEEHYDSKKVYNTCWRACLNAQLPDSEGERICQNVVKKVEEWIDSKKHVTSQDIFERVTKFLALENKDAAFMYETHRDIQ